MTHPLIPVMPSPQFLSWPERRLDALCERVNQPVESEALNGREWLLYSIPALEEFGAPVIQDGQEIDSNKIAVRAGDVLISKLNPRKSRVTTVYDHDGLESIASTEFVSLRPTSIDGRYLSWLLQSEPVRALLSSRVESVTRSHQRVNPDDIYKLRARIPAYVEQSRIANFLDDKTARIDALIAEKERLRVTLEEWRAAELTRICFGEDRKPLATGNDWMPTLPQGWKLVRLKHLVTGIEQGWSPECEARHADEDEWGVLKAGAANAGTYRQDEHKALPSAMQPMPELEVKPGDVLITRASGTADYVGSFAYVYSTRPKLMLSDKNFRLRFEPRPQLLPELLAWMCNTRALREQVLQYVSGADGLAKNIGSGSLKELWLALPPLAEQPGLIHELHARREQLEGLEKHLILHITRLREYRSSLISAAVTGQLDIESFKDSS